MTRRTPTQDLDREPVAAANGTMPAAAPGGNAEEPMTEAQAAELRDLSEQAGEPFDAGLDYHQAEDRLAYLREKA